MNFGTHRIFGFLPSLLQFSYVQFAICFVTLKIDPSSLPEFSQYTLSCANDVVNASTIQVYNGANVILSYDVMSATFGYGSDVNTLQGRSTAINSSSTFISVLVTSGYATDTGSYLCTVNTTSGAPFTSPAVVLNVSACPTQLVRTVSDCQNVAAGSACTVSCLSAVNGTTPTLSRNKDGSSALGASQSSDGETIQYNISAVQSQDAGVYYCFVKTAGCASRTVAIVSLAATGNTTAANGNTGGHGLPGWGIALIVIACILVLIAIILAILFVLFKKKKGKSSPDVERSGVHGQTAARDIRSSGIESRAGHIDRKSKHEDGKMNEPVNFPDASRRNRTLPPLNAAIGESTDGSPKRKGKHLDSLPALDNQKRNKRNDDDDDDEPPPQYDRMGKRAIERAVDRELPPAPRQMQRTDEEW